MARSCITFDPCNGIAIPFIIECLPKGRLTPRSALAGPPLEPPCTEGAVGTKQTNGLNA